MTPFLRRLLEHGISGGVDNVIANAGAGGATFATDDIAGVHHPYTKVEWGPADTANITDDAAGKRLPVKLAEVGTVTVPVSAVSLPLPAGASTEATLATRLSEADFDTKAGSLTETAPGTDTASSGLNGRLQRIAQRLTSLIALLPGALISGRLDVNLGAAPATVTVTGTVTDGGAGKTLKTAAISVAASGDNTIIALVAGKRLKVYAIVLNVVGTVSVKWKDGAATDLTGAMDFQAREGYSLALNPPAFTLATTAGNALILNLSAAIGVRGWVSYWDDDAS